MSAQESFPLRPQRLGLYSAVRTRSRPLDCWSNPTALTVRPHRNDGSQEDAKQEQPADGGLLSYTKKLCLFFKKHPPGELHNQKML